jgi:hypothetical protein
MIRNLLRYGVLIAAVGLGACEEQLAVDNPNDPNTTKVLGTPADAEALLGGYYKRWHQALYSTNNPPGNFEGMANMLALANFSSLANNCQNSRTPFTNASNPNNPGNTCQGEQRQVYQDHSEVDRVASSFLTQMDAANAAGKPFLGTVSRDNRGRAYAEFLRGLSLGYMALFYDSAAVIAPGMDAQDPGTLRPYTEVMDSALVALQRAINAANDPAGMDNIDGAWIPTPTTLDKTEFVKLIRSYRARLRVSVARTAAEHANIRVGDGTETAAAWSLVRDDALNGITADHMNTMSTTGGMGAGWRRRYLTFGLWHQMPPFIIGMGDVSGSYASWIAQPLGDRGGSGASFTMVTPDFRFPQGATRSAQQSDFAITQCNAAATPCKRYFVNRPAGSDQTAGASYGISNYDHARWNSWATSGDAGTALNGNLPFFTKAELDMILAEAYIRLGGAANFAAAAALIDKTRVLNNLPQLVGSGADVALGVAVPGGANCVPKKPTTSPTGGGTVACGDLLEAMKWEKRIETLNSHFAAWFLDGRVWGDLPKDTPLFWAVPYQDLQARGYSTDKIYGAGVGVGNAPNSTAPTSTYGW